MSLVAGTTLIARYRVIRRLGEGGMGEVYLVQEIATGERWAMKEALADTTASPEDLAWAREHFDQEVALMKQLRPVAAQAGIPTHHDDFTEQGRRYLVMDYIPGDTLEARIEAAKAPLPERDVLRWMLDVCHAMETLHHQRPPIILRDLKPGNVMLPPAGPARVIDFGIARTYKAGQFSNTENLGTLAYASPEHHGQGQTDARSDIYSLGATMYHALTGHEPQPFEAPGVGALLRWNRAITPQTEAIVVRAMQLDPEKRYQTTREMAAALQERIAALTPRPRLSATAATTARQPVATRPATPKAPTATKAPRPTRNAASAASASAAGPVCPRCGRRNRAGARFCAHDGAPLTPAAVRRQAPQAAPPTNIIATTGTTHALRATEAFTRGRYHQAIQQGQAALAEGHTTVDLLLTLARSYQQVGRPLEAAEAFERAAQTRPEAAALIAAAQAWQAVGRLSEAQVDLAKARQLAPDDAEASYLLGVVNLELGHLAQAEGDLRDTLRLAPDATPQATQALIALGRIQTERGQLDEAVESLRKASATDPTSGEARWRLGRALLAQRHFSEAIRELEESTRLDAQSADAHVTLGMAYHATGRRQRARDELREALRLAPNHTEAQRLLKGL